MIPEERLRSLLHEIVTSDNDSAILLSAVYRVEVSDDAITIWTLLDADPTGDINCPDTGVIKTPGVPSGVPIVFITGEFIRITVAR
jgi:hypothetical protein